MLPLTQMDTRAMQHTKFCSTLLILIVFVGSFQLVSAVSLSISRVNVGNFGTISLQQSLTANSGSAVDIQLAINQAVALGITNVQIPAGTFNFVEVNQPLITVNVPVGINVFGAPNQYDLNGQVIEPWKTILVLPWDAPSSSSVKQPWFWVNGRNNGNGDPNLGFRFSDIELLGYRAYNLNSPNMYIGVLINNVHNFRVDHSFFMDICGDGVWIDGYYPGTRYG